MQIKNSKLQYGAVAKFLHWLIFLLVAGLLIIGTVMHEMDISPLTLKLYGLHKATGITVLALVCVRLLWKLANTSPALPMHMRAVEKLAAKGAHWLLYGLLIAMPLSGWLMSSAAGFPVSVFGLFVLPDMVAPNHDLKEFFEEAHEWLANALMLVAGLHIFAAFFHHFYYKDTVLKSMLPFVKVNEHEDR